MKLQYKLYVLLAAVASCGPQRQPEQAVNNSTSPVLPAPTAPAVLTNQVAPAPATAPAPPSADTTTHAGTASLPEPKGPIDSKSVEAAGQIVQQYGALIEEKRWVAADKLWGSGDQAAEFAASLKSNRENHLEIGPLGKPEGAAGSIYVSMPVTFYGKDATGKAFRWRRTIVLRRVNDVPGSTEAQRHWHIERIDAQPA